MQMFANGLGAKMEHIPYKGAGQVAADLLGGQVDMYFDNLPASLANIRAGKLRALAVASDKRAPAIPDVPTFAQAGVPDFLITPWFGIMAPARTPDAALATLHGAFNEALQAPEVAAKMRTLDACRDALIVAVSGYGQPEDVRRSREAGFDRHLTKPVDLDALTAMLSEQPAT